MFSENVDGLCCHGNKAIVYLNNPQLYSAWYYI